MIFIVRIAFPRQPKLSKHWRKMLLSVINCTKCIGWCIGTHFSGYQWSPIWEVDEGSSVLDTDCNNLADKLDTLSTIW